MRSQSPPGLPKPVTQLKQRTDIPPRMYRHLSIVSFLFLSVNYTPLPYHHYIPYTPLLFTAHSSSSYLLKNQTTAHIRQPPNTNQPDNHKQS